MSTIARRDAGRSWSEISRATGRSVAELKAEVAEDKRKRRDALAHTVENERARGLLDKCYNLADWRLCGHMRKEHDEQGCAGCREELEAKKAEPEYPSYLNYYSPCGEFQAQRPQPRVGGPLNSRWPGPPDRWRPRKHNWWKRYDTPENIPHVTLTRMRKRAARKLKKS